MIDGEFLAVMQIEDFEKRFQQAELDGASFLVELAEGDAIRIPGVSSSVVDFTPVVSAIEAISTRLVEALQAAGPTSSTVELTFGVETSEDGVAALLLSDRANANISVTLHWAAGA